MPPKGNFRGIREYTQEDYAAAQAKLHGVSPPTQTKALVRKRKRQREVTACRPCRTQKISCDGSEPCANCRKRRRDDLCTYSYADEADDSAEMTGPEPGEGARERAMDNPRSRPVQNNTGDQRQMVYWGSHHWKQPIVEDLKWLGKSSRLLASQLAEVASLNAYFVPDRRRTLFNAVSIETTCAGTDIGLHLRELLPSHAVCRIMISRYLATLHRIYPIVDVNLFGHDYDLAKSVQPDQSDGLGRFALYLAIVGIGYQMPALLNEHLSSQEPKRQHGKDLVTSLRPLIISLVQQAKRPTLDLFQCLICLVLQEKLDLDWIDGNNSTAGLLALLGRTMLSLGLHRDPRHNENISRDAEMRVRRNLFWSLAMLDFEHSVYSGQPCLFPFQSSDVEVPSSIDGGAWISRLARLMPQLATDLHSFHNSASQSGLSPVKPSQEFGSLLSNRSDFLIPKVTFAERAVTTIGNAFNVCINNHLKLSANLAVIESTITSPATRSKAQDAVISYLSANLSELKHVVFILDSAPATCNSTWSLLVSALLRCPVYHTCSLAFMTANRPNFGAKKTTDNLLRDAKLVMKLLEGAVAFSHDNLKHFIFLQMQLRTMDERASYAHGQVPGSDDDVTEDSLLVLATQQAIDFGIRIARMALDRARGSDDPPPNVAAIVHPDSDPGNDTLLGVSASPSHQPYMENVFGHSDWSALFDEWLVDLGTLPGQ